MSIITQAGEWFPRLFLCPYLGMPKNAFQLAAVVVIVQMAIVLFVLTECAALKFWDKPVQCKGDKAGDLLSLITAQSFALLAAEKTIKH